MVRLGTFGMLSSIDLNHQTRRKTDEVAEIWAEWKLTSETQTMKLFAAQFLPEEFFGFGR